ncbi:Carbohydrate esterase 4 protein [Nowakowskiella sp. JEL0407]|nr:Carbohydrate esterase 4 protein [Nowakowskiella sp. JEL0407]
MLDLSSISGALTCAVNAVSITTLFTISSVPGNSHFFPEKIIPGLSPPLRNPIAFREVPWAGSKLSNTWFAELHDTKSKDPQSCRDLNPFSSGSTVASFAFSLAEETPKLSIVDISVEIGCGMSEKFYSLGKIRPTGSTMKTYTVSLDKIPKEDLKKVRGLVLESKNGKIRVANVQVVCGPKNRRGLESRKANRLDLMRRACPANILVHDFSANTLYNFLGGYSDTDGTGTMSIASGLGTWKPTTSSTTSAYWYSNLYSDTTAAGSRCLNLQAYGSTAAISIKVAKTSTSAATLVVAVNLGCSSNTYTQIGTISMTSGAVASTVYTLNLGLSATQLATVNSILLVAGTNVPTGSIFTVDDLQITCSGTAVTITTTKASTTTTRSSTTTARLTTTTTRSTASTTTKTTTTTLKATTTTTATATSSCKVTPLAIQDFSSSSQLNTNLLNGYSDTDGTGTIAISSGVATWSPITSSTTSAYWYTELFSGSAASGSQCTNLSAFGSTVAVSVKVGKNTSSAAKISVGVDVGCSSTKSFRTLGTISLPAGVVTPKVYNINILPGLASPSDIASIKAVLLLAYSTDVPTGSVFTLDEVQINCAGTIPSPTIAPSPTTTVFTSPTPTGTLCTAPGGDIYERIAGTRPIIAERCRLPGQFAFTFDDGPKLYEHQLLTKLAGYGVKVTFFFNSNNWVNITTEPYRSWVKSAFDAGHQIASHTATHPYLTSLTSAQILTELKQVEDAFFSIFGKKPAVMRPPFGDFNDAVMKTIESAGYNSAAIWNVDTQDWQHNNVTQSMAYVKDALETKCPIPGSASILELSHSTTSSSVDLVDAMIPYVKSRGYKFVTVAECLGVPAYK